MKDVTEIQYVTFKTTSGITKRAILVKQNIKTVVVKFGELEKTVKLNIKKHRVKVWPKMTRPII